MGLAAAKHVLRRESQKLSWLECRLEIYTTILEQVAQVAFNEIRLATDHTSNNDTKIIRAIVTFKQAGMLVDGVSLQKQHTQAEAMASARAAVHAARALSKAQDKLAAQGKPRVM